MSINYKGVASLFIVVCWSRVTRFDLTLQFMHFIFFYTLLRGGGGKGFSFPTAGTGRGKTQLWHWGLRTVPLLLNTDPLQSWYLFQSSQEEPHPTPKKRISGHFLQQDQHLAASPSPGKAVTLTPPPLLQFWRECVVFAELLKTTATLVSLPVINTDQDDTT